MKKASISTSAHVNPIWGVALTINIFSPLHTKHVTSPTLIYNIQCVSVLAYIQKLRVSISLSLKLHVAVGIVTLRDYRMSMKNPYLQMNMPVVSCHLVVIDFLFYFFIPDPFVTYSPLVRHCWTGFVSRPAVPTGDQLSRWFERHDSVYAVSERMHACVRASICRYLNVTLSQSEDVTVWCTRHEASAYL